MKADMKGNWLSRHLNWTFFLYALLLPISIYAFVDFLGALQILPVLILLWIVSLYWQIMVAVWYLRNKNRSLWNLLWFLASYIGFIVLLFLRNKNTKGRYFNLLYEDNYNAQVRA